MEAVDELGRRIASVPHLPFGGKVVMLVGDFRQFPPTVRDELDGSFVDQYSFLGREEQRAACLHSASFWPVVQVLQLHTNMRLQQMAGQRFSAEELESVGDGTAQTQIVNGEACIRLPDEICLPVGQRSLQALIDFVWGDLCSRWDDFQWVTSRSILAGAAASFATLDDHLVDVIQWNVQAWPEGTLAACERLMGLHQHSGGSPASQGQIVNARVDFLYCLMMQCTTLELLYISGACSFPLSRACGCCSDI